MTIEEIKEIIEENPGALATSNSNVPHVIGVAFIKIKDNKIIITDIDLEETIENIKKNSNVSLAVWDEEWEGYEIKGKAEYVQAGDYFDFVKSLEENEDEQVKGAIIISPENIKEI